MKKVLHVMTTNPNNIIKEKLSTYFKEKRLTQEMIAQRFGVSQAYINGLLTGKRPFGKKQARRWNEEFGFSEAWLLTGKGEMFEDRTEEEELFVPLIPTSASAGPLQAISQGVMEHECTRLRSPYPRAQFALQITGDSMEPKFPDGAIVYVARIDDSMFIPWGYTHVVDTINGVFIKNIYQNAENPECFTAKSINPNYPPFLIPFKAVYGFYEVLGMQVSFSIK